MLGYLWALHRYRAGTNPACVRSGHQLRRKVMIPGIAYAASLIGQVGLVASTSLEGLSTLTPLERAVAIGGFAYALLGLVVLGTLTWPGNDLSARTAEATDRENLKKAA
jgi:hypothetical protein